MAKKKRGPQPIRKTPEQEIREIWAKVPDVGCKGLCDAACGPIDMSGVERRMMNRRGFDPRLSHMRCPALGVDGRCMAYDVRPIICRLYGATDDPRLRCPHGCEPVLDNPTAFRLLGDTMRVGGEPDSWGGDLTMLDDESFDLVLMAVAQAYDDGT